MSTSTRQGQRKMWGQWDRLERQFLDAWKEVFGDTPRDWNNQAWARGTSTLSKWFDWLGRMYPPPSVQLMLRCMQVFRDNYRSPTYYPSLYDFRNLYDMKSGRVRRKVPKTQKDVNPLPPEEVTRLLEQAFPEYGKKRVSMTEKERRQAGLEPN